MTSVFTFGAHNSNPLSSMYGAMAVKASKCGSKNFIYTRYYDDRHPFPRHHHRQSDVPWRDCFTYARYRWMLHDFRMFGLAGAIRKHYYIGEGWRRKDEKIFVGKDELGNKYWMSRRNQGTLFTRMVEPADPHWFRGQGVHNMPPQWIKWLNGNMAHTPAQIKARGEFGLNARLSRPLPFSMKWAPWAMLTAGEAFSRDPAHVPASGSILNPDQPLLREVGFTRWGRNQGFHTTIPFTVDHGYSDDLVEEYWRGDDAFCRRSTGNDHDEWQN